MENISFVLKLIFGAGMIILFIFSILYSLNESPTRFIKYLLGYLSFFAAIGFLFYLFREATLYIALLAGLGWVFHYCEGRLWREGQQ